MKLFTLLTLVLLTGSNALGKGGENPYLPYSQIQINPIKSRQILVKVRNNHFQRLYLSALNDLRESLEVLKFEIPYFRVKEFKSDYVTNFCVTLNHSSLVPTTASRIQRTLDLFPKGVVGQLDSDLVERCDLL